MNTSYLLFVDDVLLFAKADNTSLSSIKNTFDHFCKTSGMEINFNISKLWLSPGISDERKNPISQLLQINNTPNLGTYLGLPLKPNNTQAEFNYIIHNIRQCLQGWKMSSLSFPGRCQFLQHSTKFQIIT